MRKVKHNPQQWTSAFDAATLGDDSNLAWFWRWQMAELIWGDGNPGENQARVMHEISKH